MVDYEWDNKEWLEEFGVNLPPEYWMWLDKLKKEQAIKEILNGD